MNDSLKISFEYTLDEGVAFHADYLRETKEGASLRKREQLMFMIALLATIAFLGWMASDRSPTAIAGLAGIALVVVPIATALFGGYYDHRVKRRLRRIMSEQLGGPGPYTCAIEIRPEGLWVTQPTIQLIFPWRDGKKVEDAAEGIIVTFTGGRVLARTRGFTSPEHRTKFVVGLHKQIPATPPESPAA